MLMHAFPHGSVVMVLDPAPGHLHALSAALSRRGFRIVTVERADLMDGRQLGQHAVNRADLLLLRLPGSARDRLEFIRHLRSRCNLPCVIVSDRGETAAERIAALELGADDYLLYTTSQPEMVARIQSVLRRAGRGPSAESVTSLSTPVPMAPAPSVALVGGWQLAAQRRALVSADSQKTVRLTGAEYDLLRVLAAANGNPIDRDSISLAVFRRPWRVGDRAVDSLVKRLRQKCPADAIATVRGRGYALLLEGQPVPFDQEAADA